MKDKKRYIQGVVGADDENTPERVIKTLQQFLDDDLELLIWHREQCGLDLNLTLLRTGEGKNTAMYDCLPEGREEAGFELELDLKSRKILKNSYGAENLYTKYAAEYIFQYYGKTEQTPPAAEFSFPSR